MVYLIYHYHFTNNLVLEVRNLLNTSLQYIYHYLLAKYHDSNILKRVKTSLIETPYSTINLCFPL